LVAGDSITERAHLPDKICGHPLINAGIGGLDVSAYHEAFSEIGVFRVSAIVVALGTNDARAGHARDFADQYESLLRAMSPHSPRLFLAGLPPIENGEFSSLFDQAAHTKINLEIHEIARRTLRPFINFASATAGARATMDGVHLNADGYRHWLNATGAVLSAALCS
jgi:lysophospholipase L1-like esterase